MIRPLIVIALLAAAPALAAPPVLDTPVKDDYWQAARTALGARLRAVNRPKRAKNVILMIGDGMGIATITAARIYDGQHPAEGPPRPGEENSLAFEALPNVALVKTYNSNAQVPDSAGTASAINTGVKTRIGTINFGQAQDAAACKTPEALPTTLAEIAKRRGMGVGVVTTTRITHATPAAVFAHVPNRNWEGADRAFPAADRASGCRDIARQLVEFAPASTGGLDVALGGGRARFLPVARGGSRDDGQDLVAAWQARFPAGRYVDGAAGFAALDPRAPGPVLGLFNNDHLTFEVDRDPAAEPALADMARFAVAKLAASAAGRRNGYYLMIEGGRIDHAHHASNASRALSETQQFSRAVAAVLATINLDETLLLVTADHSHTMTISGYPERGNDILGFIRNAAAGEGGGPVSPEGFALDDQGRPMTTLTYANGPRSSPPLSPTLPPNDRNRLQDKTYGTQSESHGGEDVAAFAAGPRSNLVTGVVEQNLLFHIMAEALGWR